MTVLARILVPTAGAAAIYWFAAPAVMIAACVFAIVTAMVMLPRIKGSSVISLLLYPTGFTFLALEGGRSWGVLTIAGLAAIAASGVFALRYKEIPQRKVKPPVASATSSAAYDPNDPFPEEEILSVADLAKVRARREQEKKAIAGTNPPSPERNTSPSRPQKPLRTLTEKDLDIYG